MQLRADLAAHAPDFFHQRAGQHIVQVLGGKGGRLSILGAVYGTLLVNFAKTSFSESFPELWLFGLGGLFIAVVLAFPNGLAGIWSDYVQPRIDRLLRKKGTKNGWTDTSVADGAPAE
eukprot:gene38688-52267_t